MCESLSWRPVGDAQSVLAEWRTIQAADIDRIEALRGPGSSLYGDTSLGGAVQVFTVRRGAWVEASGGTFRSGQVGGGATARLRKRGIELRPAPSLDVRIDRPVRTARFVTSPTRDSRSTDSS
jgi:outer membrane receptor protein involved in Fe transport